MWQRFTERARHVVLRAQKEAGQAGSPHVGTEHLLLGLLREGEGTAAQVLAAMDVDFDKLRAQAQPAADEKVAEPKLAPEAKRVLELAHEESRRMGHKAIGTEHLLLALLRETDGSAAKYLSAAGVELERAREHILSLSPAETRQRQARVVRPRSEPLESPEEREARARRENEEAVARMLDFLLRDSDFAARTLAKCGLDVEAAQKRLRKFLETGE